MAKHDAEKSDNKSKRAKQKPRGLQRLPLLLNCGGMLLLSLLLIAIFYFSIAYYTHHGEEVKVPNVTGINAELAIKKLKAIGLDAEVADTGYVDTKAPDEVLLQDIEAGHIVKVGRRVLLTINANGARNVVLPDLIDNCSAREARDRLQIIGFRVAKIEYVDGEPDWVYGIIQNGRHVAAGMRLSVKAPLTLVVGRGQEVEFDGNDSLYNALNPDTLGDYSTDPLEIETPATNTENSESLFE